MRDKINSNIKRRDLVLVVLTRERVIRVFGGGIWTIQHRVSGVTLAPSQWAAFPNHHYLRGRPLWMLTADT